MKSSEMEYKAEWKKYKENPVTSQIPTLFHIIGGGYVVIKFFLGVFAKIFVKLHAQIKVV